MGSAMGMSPNEVAATSLWRFNQALEGWRRANGDNRPEPPTEDEFDAAVRRAIEEQS